MEVITEVHTGENEETDDCGVPISSCYIYSATPSLPRLREHGRRGDRKSFKSPNFRTPTAR